MVDGVSYSSSPEPTPIEMQGSRRNSEHTPSGDPLASVMQEVLGRVGRKAPIVLRSMNVHHWTIDRLFARG